MYDVETGEMWLTRVESGGWPDCYPGGIRHEGGVTLHLALARNVGTCRPNAKGEVQAGGPRKEWNTMAMMKIITELRAAGEIILDEDLRISPLMHQHVIPNGTYHFARYKPGNDIA